MREPPYDRALVLASLVATMRDHYLAVDCGCGVHRVIGLGVAGRDPRTKWMTMAHFALRVRCEGCEPGPDRVVLCATAFGLWPSSMPAAGDPVWALPLVERDPPANRRLKYVSRPDHSHEYFVTAWQRRAGSGLPKTSECDDG
jgi:hypothetical protein